MGTQNMGQQFWRVHKSVCRPMIYGCITMQVWFFVVVVVVVCFEGLFCLFWFTSAVGRV